MIQSGWDEGIVGMQVGGERRLTLPPNMAYGKKGTDGIPKNSTLIFGQSMSLYETLGSDNSFRV
jgi:FKBP-type peptidyl-prolyl cis-trans isomerase